MIELDYARVLAIIGAREEGHSLARACYLDESLYRVEMDAIWRSGWIFAGHSCEARDEGNYFTYEIDGDPLLIVRQGDGSLRAFHNVCRHRGSVVVLDDAGVVSRFVCPYHGWIYDLDGRLTHCRGAPDGWSPELGNLFQTRVAELAGLVFISLAADPPSIEQAVEEFGRMAGAQGLEWAKVARRIDYQVEANWKLVWENNRECFHCDINHPEYIRANFDRYDDDDGRHLEEASSQRARAATALRAGGISDDLYSGAGLAHFPDESGKRWWSVGRTALRDGFITESIDGNLVAPVMGDYTDPAVGTLRMRALPNFWCHASCDHAVTTRLTPCGPRSTLVSVSWLVDSAAVEGRDYALDRLLPFWQNTSEQDWAICARQQRGVSSSAFVPGPLSPLKEPNVERFLQWYTSAVNAAAGTSAP